MFVQELEAGSAQFLKNPHTLGFWNCRDDLLRSYFQIPQNITSSPSNQQPLNPDETAMIPPRILHEIPMGKRKKPGANPSSKASSKTSMKPGALRSRPITSSTGFSGGSSGLACREGSSTSKAVLISMVALDWREKSSDFTAPDIGKIHGKPYGFRLGSYQSLPSHGSGSFTSTSHPILLLGIAIPLDTVRHS